MIRRRREGSLGKTRATRVRRLSSWLMWQVFFQPRSELWSGESKQGDDFLEALLSGGEAGAKEDAADGASNIGALVDPWDVSLCVFSTSSARATGRAVPTPGIHRWAPPQKTDTTREYEKQAAPSER